MVDYFSRFPEMTKLSSTLSASVIAALKSMFSRYGLPEIFRSDNVPQYSSDEFMKEHGINHITSGPRQVERTVQTVKRLFKRSADHYAALLSYRSTPLPWCSFNPVELLIGRRLRTTVAQTDKVRDSIEVQRATEEQFRPDT